MNLIIIVNEIITLNYIFKGKNKKPFIQRDFLLNV